MSTASDGMLSGRGRQYTMGSLRKSSLACDPMAQFEAWFREWEDVAPSEANAVIVATSDTDGWPSARAVLLKGFDGRGFVFYTNRRSAKGRDIEATGRASMGFLWQPLERQVRVVGTVDRLPSDESDAYFASRPRGSQIGAWASPQSAVIGSRAELERLYKAAAARFAVDAADFAAGAADFADAADFAPAADAAAGAADAADIAAGADVGYVPRPPYWGGYLLRPLTVEFWQGGRSRMHDRLRYCRPNSELGLSADESSWTVERLAP